MVCSSAPERATNDSVHRRRIRTKTNGDTVRRRPLNRRATLSTSCALVGVIVLTASRAPVIVCHSNDALSSVAGLSTDSSPSDPPRLPRDTLLVFHDDQGILRPVLTPSDWERRGAEIVRGMETVMGKLPGNAKRCALDLQIADEVDCGTYVRRFITYESEPGSRVPAYLLVPKKATEPGAKVPAILCLHPTDNV